MKYPKIALLSGGLSKEREVSLKSGKKIYETLKKKYRVFQYDPKKDMEKLWRDALSKKIDLVFPALHGSYGEDGKLQGFLETLGVPYIFSGVLASSLAMDKHRSKILISNKGIPVAKDLILRKKSEENIPNLEFPLVIKPVNSGSSVGISITKNKQQLKKGIEEAFSHDEEIMIEEYIKGRELTVTILGNEEPRALPVLEIKPKNSEWFDYESKYTPGATEEICPAKIPQKIEKKIQGYAKEIFLAIGCRDLARVDFIWDQNSGKIYFLEINTIPGMTGTSLVPQTARADGLNFERLLDKLIEMGNSRRKHV